MADLVEATGSTRQSIYGDFGSKHGLYHACFDWYRDRVVQPAIAPVSNGEQGIASIAEYFETQISLAQDMGLPGPGCLVGNAMTETAPTDDAIKQCVAAHNERLKSAFAQSLPADLETDRKHELAGFLVVSAQGLWALSRITSDADELRAHAATILRMLNREIEGAKR